MSNIPMLSPDGWCTDNDDKVNKLLEHYLCTEEAQSLTYRKHVYSFKFQLSNYKDDYELAEAIKRDLTEIYSNYFDSVEVFTDYTEGTDVNIIVIDITCSKDGNIYTLNKSINYKNNKLLNFSELIAQLYTGE